MSTLAVEVVSTVNENGAAGGRPRHSNSACEGLDGTSSAPLIDPDVHPKSASRCFVVGSASRNDDGNGRATGGSRHAAADVRGKE